MNTPLQKAAQDLLDRWNSPFPMPTGTLIAELRKALGAELAQTVEPDAWLRHDSFKAMTDDEKAAWIESGNAEVVEEYTKPLYLHPPQQAEPSGERAKVGDSRFEGWYSELNQAGKGSKQIAREAYEAGLNEANAQLHTQLARRTVERDMAIAMASSVDAQQAKPKTMGEVQEMCVAALQRASLIADLRQLEGEQMHSTHATWVCAAADMLEADAQQAKQVPMTDGEIYTAYISATNQTLRAQDERLALAFARAIEQHYGIKNI